MKKWLLLLFLPAAGFAADPLDPSFLPAVDQTASHYSTAFGTITVTDSLYKVFRSSQTNATMNHWYIGYQTKNEFQSIQVHIRPTTNMPSVNVTMSNLVSTQPVAYTITASTPDIVIYKEYYMNVSTPSCLSTSTFMGGARDYMPDPLIPKVDPYWHQVTDAFPVPILSTQTQTAWIDVHIPTAAPSGYYTGSIWVSSGGVVVSTLPVMIGVWNYLMPSTATLRTAGAGFNNNGMRDVAYGGVDASAATYPNAGSSNGATTQSWVDGTSQLLDNRWTAYSLDNYFPADIGASQWARFLHDYSPLLNGTPTHASTAFPISTILPGAQMTTFRLNSLGTPAAFVASRWQDWVSTFTAQGWIDKLANKLVDEPAGASWPPAVSSGTATRTFSTPIIPNAVTTDLVSAQASSGAYVIDWIIPIISNVDTSVGDVRSTYDTYLTLSSGVPRQIGSYIDCVQGGTCGNGTIGPANNRPYPNRMIDGTPVANRAMETWEYLDRISLELYFALDYCANNPKALCAGPSIWTSVYAFGNQGDGTIMYESSATVVTVSTPIWCPSIRLKHFRDGEQDYEYESYLGTHGYSTFVSSQITTWMLSGHSFHNDPADLRAARLAMGNLIHQLSLSSAPVITSALNVSGTVGVAFNYQITASTTVTSYAAPGLPSGLSINTGTGLISGTPIAVQVATATISATNANGTGSAALTMTFTSAAPVITSPATASGTVGSAFSYQITATNSPTSFNADVLPDGLSVSGVSGLISGTPTTAAVSTTTISAINSSGTGTQLLTFTIGSVPPPPPPPSTGTSEALQGQITIQGRIKFQ